MGKQKKKKDNYEDFMEAILIRKYLKDNSKANNSAYGVSQVLMLGKNNPNETQGGIEDVIAEERVGNYVIEKVLERITPYMAEQLRKEMNDKKQQKAMKKRVQKLENRIAKLESEQERLCKAMAYFFAGSMHIPASNLSAADLEKGFKELYKNQRKMQKHTSKKSSEMLLLPMESH